MLLAFQLSDLVTVPFGWLLGVLYRLTDNYGVSMILFALIVQLVLMPTIVTTLRVAKLLPRRYAARAVL